jgi:DNA-binding MarR family transcriptional regulator
MNEKRIHSFRRNLRRFERLNQLANTICCKGITLAQCHVLLEIETLGKTTTKQLAENLKLDKSTLSRTVNGLKKLGLVKRATHVHDRRYTVLTLTKKGKVKCDGLNKFNDSLYNDIFGKFPPKEREIFFQSFNDMIQAFSKYYREKNLCQISVQAKRGGDY